MLKQCYASHGSTDGNDTLFLVLLFQHLLVILIYDDADVQGCVMWRARIAAPEGRARQMDTHCHRSVNVTQAVDVWQEFEWSELA